LGTRVVGRTEKWKSENEQSPAKEDVEESKGGRQDTTVEGADPHKSSGKDAGVFIQAPAKQGAIRQGEVSGWGDPPASACEKWSQVLTPEKKKVLPSTKMKNMDLERGKRKNRKEKTKQSENGIGGKFRQ